MAKLQVQCGKGGLAQLPPNKPSVLIGRGLVEDGDRQEAVRLMSEVDVALA
jgi:hypothetical protein